MTGHQSSITIQTFNTFGPIYGPNLQRRTRLLAEKISRQDPARFLFLQEVWRDAHYQDLRRQPGLLRAGYEFVRFDENRGDRQKRCGLLTLGPGAPDQSWLRDFPVNEGTGPIELIRRLVKIVKGMGIARFTLPDTAVLCVNTHTHPTNARIRLDQMICLADTVRDLHKDELLVLAGDLNAPPASLEIRYLKTMLGLTDAYEEANGTYAPEDCTYSADNPYAVWGQSRVLDYVFYRSPPAGAWRSQRAAINLRQWKNRWLSDHFGVRAELVPLPPGSAQDLPRSSRETQAIIDEAIAFLQADETPEADWVPTIKRLTRQKHPG